LWQPILMWENVETLSLSESAAVEIGSWHRGSQATRHVVWEAAHLVAPIITAAPSLYHGFDVRLWPI
ncbi:MAG TPA: hypothetical protein VF657_22845, partial [Actinoplanes sp.]|jgi:hypothetical protein